jgi:hypothetical protein
MVFDDNRVASNAFSLRKQSRWFIGMVENIDKQRYVEAAIFIR